MTAQSAAPRSTKMTIFTIDNENNITALATAEAAAAASTTPFDLFTDQKELAELLAGSPAQRWVATYNSLKGVEARQGAEGLQDGCQQDLGARGEARPAGHAGASGGQ